MTQFFENLQILFPPYLTQASPEWRSAVRIGCDWSVVVDADRDMSGTTSPHLPSPHQRVPGGELLRIGS